MRKKTTFWPLAIITLIASFCLLSGWSFYRAASGVSPMLDEEYQRYGLRFSGTEFERRAADSIPGN